MPQYSWNEIQNRAALLAACDKGAPTAMSDKLRRKVNPQRCRSLLAKRVMQDLKDNR